MVLICSFSDDESTLRIVDALRKNNEVFRLRLENYVTLKPEFLINTESVKNFIGEDLSSVTAAYYRLLAFPYLPKSEMPEMYQHFLRRELITLFLGQIMLLPPQRIMNHPFLAHRASFKMTQLKEARDLGFTIPKTCITTNRECMLEFYTSLRKSGLEVITKAIHVGHVQAENPNDDEMVFTQDVEIGDIGKIPTDTPLLFQEKISGDYETRCFVIGDTILAAKIESPETDYRLQSPSSIKVESVDLPDRVKSLCINLVRTFGLWYGAIDLIFKGGIAYFLDLNPSGEWIWYEDRVGLPISDAIARYLTVLEKVE